jgi:hypothetical protein
MSYIQQKIFLPLISFIFFLLPFSFLFLFCDKSTAPVNNPVVTLTAEYVGVTEADIRLQTENIESPTEFRLLRDDSLISRGYLTTSDTLLTDTLLLPAQTYSYRVQLLKKGQPAVFSQTLPITTIDTTSHDFQWEAIEFPSPFGSATLNDLAIVNENDIWAVGEIYSDSAQTSFRYNAVHWEGAQWRLQRITVRFRNSDITPPGEGIFAFSNSDIWVTLGGAPAHWDGSNWTLYHLWDMGVLTQNDGGVTRIWGNSPDNVYFAGRGGTIVHYNGSSWQKIESGTDLPIQDIWGGRNEKKGVYEVICVASRLDQNEGSELLKINNNSVEKLQTEGLSWSLKAIWFIPGVIYYIGGDGLYPSRNLADRWKAITSPLLYKHAIRGQAVNDVIVAGSFGLLSHFNGLSWRHYNGGHFPSTNAAYRGVAIHDNIIVAVGYHNLRNGFVVVGRRNQ